MSIFSKKEKQSELTVIPRHVAIIMDGNGRWAKKRGLPRNAGHKVGANTFRTIADYLNDIGVEYMTFYAFSSENWKRDQQEVDGIMNILCDYLKEAIERIDETNMRMNFIGDRSVLKPELVELMNEVEKLSADKPGAVFNVAINYGGRQEIAYACKKIAEKVKSGEIDVDDIDEDMISAHIYTADQPDPDIIIRPSGEYRLSNFLIWQAAYSEFYYDDILWPDYSKKDVDRALQAFATRQRRFGA